MNSEFFRRMTPKFSLIVFLTAVLASGCGSLTIHQSNKDWDFLDTWDRNNNESLDLGEFVQGYIDADFFEKWQEKSRPISDSVFLLRTFGFLDRNHDHTLDSVEYSSRRIFWSFRGKKKLENWDVDQDKVLELEEFIQKAQTEAVTKEFDLTDDGQVTEGEMAQAMFDVCDKNNDDQVRSMEFYLWELYRR